ncbi:MAG: DUF1697 domain-containing protein [Maritimibacter sp.]|nr:DUF1697 domain-containing protein [Maritimibacter sp.]
MPDRPNTRTSNPWVLLLRGINVGGHGKLPMAELKALLLRLGASNVTTYIQSGNAVFTGALDPNAFARDLAEAIDRNHGFRPNIQLFIAESFREIVAAYPFPEAHAEPKTGHVWFCAQAPAPDTARLDALAAPTERYRIAPRALYLHAPDGIGRSKLAERAEALLGVPTTARNLNTCTKLVALLDDLAAG